MAQTFTAPRGTEDVLSPDSEIYQYIQNTARQMFHLYGYKEIQTPIFEHTDLFVRGVGEATDVVSKEMYTFQDKKGRWLSLRPEGTAGAIRAYIEHNLGAQNPVNKLFYIGPMFRYERPQKGRLRQHTQIGCECIGSISPSLDVEVIALFRAILQAIGLKDVIILLNSLGDQNCRPQYKEALQNYFRENLSKLCKDCNERFEKNPLRILDCKVESCQEVVQGSPVMVDYLCDDCKTHFTKVQQMLTDLNIQYKLNNRLVRGLDYYTRTVFECQVAGLGAQNAVGGGGRYDNLVAELGGPPTPALGFGTGIERLALTLQNYQITIPSLSQSPVILVGLGEAAIQRVIKLAQELRSQNIPVDMDHRFGSFKSQLKYADKLGASFVFILGENELAKNIILKKNMKTGEQVEISLDEVTASLK